MRKEPYIMRKEPYIMRKEPYIMRKEHFIIGNEPEAPVIHHVEGYTTLRDTPH